MLEEDISSLLLFAPVCWKATPSDLAENQRIAWEPHGYRTERCAEISAGVPTGGQVGQVTETPSPFQHEAKNKSAPNSLSQSS